MDYSMFYPPAVFVHIALLFYVFGFLVRDGLILRILVLCGTLFYILYYYFISDTPLWEAIFASLAIGAANIFGIVLIARERSTIGMSSDSKAIYELFPTLNPGQFRQIMKRAEEITAQEETELCQQGVHSNKLFLIKSKHVTIGRDGKTTKVGAGKFIGELSFLLRQSASATVTAPEGGVYFQWKSDDLRKLMQKSPELSNALIAMLNNDIATKLSVSWPDQKSA